jgi:hypothetical protein
MFGGTLKEIMMQINFLMFGGTLKEIMMQINFLTIETKKTAPGPTSN